MSVVAEGLNAGLTPWHDGWPTTGSATPFPLPVPRHRGGAPASRRTHSLSLLLRSFCPVATLPLCVTFRQHVTILFLNYQGYGERHSLSRPPCAPCLGTGFGLWVWRFGDGVSVSFSVLGFGHCVVHYIIDIVTYISYRCKRPTRHTYFEISKNLRLESSRSRMLCAQLTAAHAHGHAVSACPTPPTHVKSSYRTDRRLRLSLRCPSGSAGSGCYW
jgi:hypothetical protein